jgi:hypothetical protein
MGVYQQLDLVKHACRWILLQPSARALQRLKQFIALDQPDEVPAFGPDLLEPHVLIFLALARNWGECLRLLRSDLAELVRPSDLYR